MARDYLSGNAHRSNGAGAPAPTPMPMRNRLLLLTLACVLVAATLVVSLTMFAGTPTQADDGRLKVAVLGDSDSHHYADPHFPLQRGGAYHDAAWNWAEIWAMTRAHEVDLGPMVDSGHRRSVAAVMDRLTRPTRVPRKLDFAYNYTRSGLRCRSLLDAWPEQTRWLLTRLRQTPTAWRDGLVIIRIGVNDFGQRPDHRRFALTGYDEHARTLIEACLDAHRRTLAAIRAVSDVHVALIGIAHDYNRPTTYEDWPEVADVRRIADVLGRFDAGLRRLASTDARVAFIDDVGWFRARLGDRTDGTLRDRFELVPGMEIWNRLGDRPDHLVLADDHAGTVAGGLFLTHLINGLNAAFDWQLTALSDSEIAALVAPALHADSSK